MKLSNSYSEAVSSNRTYRKWFRRLKNGEFYVEGRHVEVKKKFSQDVPLDAFFKEDSSQCEKELTRPLGISAWE